MAEEVQEKPKFDMFRGLQKLFSRSVIVHLPDNKLRVIDIHKLQSTDLQTNRIIDKYTGAWSSARSTDVMQYQTVGINQVRTSLYGDFEAMDGDPIIASAIDIMAEETCNKNEYNELIRIKTENQQIQDSLNNLFYDILNIDFNLYPWTRNLVKYGDTFLRLEIAEKIGVTDAMLLSNYATSRLENFDGSQVKFLYDSNLSSGNSQHILRSTAAQEFGEYEVGHFRLLSDTNFLPYGKSMLEPARKIWKRITLMEDAMMLHRIMRAPAKRIFKIDVGSIPPAQINTYMQQVIDKLKKVPYIDNATGQYNLQFNLMNMLEDYFLPVRGTQSGNQIDQLPGLEYAGTEDITYLQKQLFAALKVPKAFLNYDETINAKSTLTSEDIRFARAIERVQQVIQSELTKIGMVHLYAQGYRGEELVDFEIELNSPSKAYEQQKLDLWTTRVSIARDLKDLKMFSEDWIYKEVFNLSEEEIATQSDLIKGDLYKSSILEKISSGDMNPNDMGGMGTDTTGQVSDMTTNDQADIAPEPAPSAPTEGRKKKGNILTEAEDLINKIEKLVN